MNDRHELQLRPGETLVVHVADPDESHQHPRPSARRRSRPVETKPFFVTSEFVLALAAWVALLLTTLASDALDADTFLVLTVAIAAGYMLSRGFAKGHAASSAWDPRER